MEEYRHGPNESGIYEPFEARMKSGIPVKWRIADKEEFVKNPEGMQKVKKGDVVITREEDDSWPKSMEDFRAGYHVHHASLTHGTGFSKGGGPWHTFEWDPIGGNNGKVPWGPHTSYINTHGKKKWPRAEKEFNMYYERKNLVNWMPYHHTNKKVAPN